jgi:fumarylacetoacetase
MARTAAAAWLGIGPDDPFGLEALPYGSFSATHHLDQPRVGVAIGDRILDLGGLTARLLPGRAHLFSGGNLDLFLAAGHRAWDQVRAGLSTWLSQDIYRGAVEDLLVPAAEAELHLPFSVGDYADFYASEHHAANVGRILRPGAAPLRPNWRHMPVGYHGRSGTVVVSHTPVRRPCGQSLPPGAIAPGYGPSARLDFEAELGFVVGLHSLLSEPIPASRFSEHVFGACLVNDWSARDLQAWESAPLGPFLGKSFATTISPWVVPLAALEQARIRPPSRDTGLLPYLTESQDWGLDIDFEVRINEQLVSRPRYRVMHWSPAQMLAHLTANGASVRTGDLFASGTVSGPDPAEQACLLELSWNGTKPITLPDGATRAWLEDSDEVTITATAPGPGGARIGFGDASGQVIPAIEEAVG